MVYQIVVWRFGKSQSINFIGNRKLEFYVVKKMSINLDIVFVAARRAETALAAERNEFKISAMRTGIHGAAVRRVTTMNHLVDIFQ